MWHSIQTELSKRNFVNIDASQAELYSKIVRVKFSLDTFNRKKAKGGRKSIIDVNVWNGRPYRYVDIVRQIDGRRRAAGALLGRPPPAGTTFPRTRYKIPSVYSRESSNPTAEFHQRPARMDPSDLIYYFRRCAREQVAIVHNFYYTRATSSGGKSRCQKSESRCCDAWAEKFEYKLGANVTGRH